MPLVHIPFQLTKDLEVSQDHKCPHGRLVLFSAALGQVCLRMRTRVRPPCWNAQGPHPHQIRAQQGISASASSLVIRGNFADICFIDPYIHYQPNNQCTIYYWIHRQLLSRHCVLLTLTRLQPIAHRALFLSKNRRAVPVVQYWSIRRERNFFFSEKMFYLIFVFLQTFMYFHLPYSKISSKGQDASISMLSWTRFQGNMSEWVRVL